MRRGTTVPLAVGSGLALAVVVEVVTGAAVEVEPAAVGPVDVGTGVAVEVEGLVGPAVWVGTEVAEAPTDRDPSA